MPYVHLLWTPSTMWLPFRKYGVRLWRRVRFWRGARIVTRMTPNALYTRSNSLLMCFGVPFHGKSIVPLTSALEDSVHQLQRNSCPMDTVCLLEKTWSRLRQQVALLSPLKLCRRFFLSSDSLLLFSSASSWTKRTKMHFLQMDEIPTIHVTLKFILFLWTIVNLVFD